MTDTPIPKCYVIVTSYVTCRNCAHTANTSDFFARTTIRARFAHGKPVTHLESCAAPLYHLPVEHVAVQRTTAFCIRCHTVDLSHLPPPPSADQLYDLAEPVLRTTPRKPPAKQAAETPRAQARYNIKDLA